MTIKMDTICRAEIETDPLHHITIGMGTVMKMKMNAKKKSMMDRKMRRMKRVDMKRRKMRVKMRKMRVKRRKMRVKRRKRMKMRKMRVKRRKRMKMRKMRMKKVDMRMNVRRMRMMKKKENGSKIVNEIAGNAVTEDVMKMRKRKGTGGTQAGKMSQATVKGMESPA